MKCKSCNKRLPNDAAECFSCKIRSISFNFVGGGGYTRSNWNSHTIAEKRADVLGDKVLGVDAEPASNFGW